MELEVLTYLADIDLSLDRLFEYRNSVSSFTAFIGNPMLIDAVERRLSIIGEALYQANKLDKELQISDKKKIIGMRHILVHDYDRISPETLYVILMNNVDLLKSEVSTILQHNPARGSGTLDD